jgi:hypothetical protein
MKLRKKAKKIFLIISSNFHKTIREIAEETSIPKSSVHRSLASQKKRINSVGHDFFETEIGAEFLRRLFYCVIFIFGIQAGVGSETISLFFSTMLLTFYVASSASCIRGVKKELRSQTETYGEQHMAEVIARCKEKELHLGGDETFFGKSVIVVLMELVSGFIFTEALTSNRTYKTWWNAIKDKLKNVTKKLSFTSDGGNVLKKLGKKIKCENNMDLFHFLNDPKKLFATKFHSKRSSINAKKKDLLKTPLDVEKDQEQALLALDDKLVVINKGQKAYKNTMFAISTQLHPFKNTFEPKNSKELSNELHNHKKVFAEIAHTCEIKDTKKLIERFGNRIEPSSLLNDLWHSWVEQSILCKTKDPEIQIWAKAILLPYFYFKEQYRKSKRKPSFRIHYNKLAKKAKQLLDAHPLTNKYLNEDWENWGKAMALKYQRSTSAIEGRNAKLSQHYFLSRGILAAHMLTLTIIHNFWIKRHDKTTASKRLCDYTPPDLFEHLLQNMPDVPIPRQPASKLSVAA